VSTARDHAVTASELLDQISRVDEQLDQLDEMQRLERGVTGATRHYNEQVRFLVELASAHACAAIALQLTEAEVLA
jgi:hypothetical protein